MSFLGAHENKNNKMSIEKNLCINFTIGYLVKQKYK